MSDSLYIPAGASEREIAIRKRVHAQAEFFQHLVIYLAVITALFGMNAFQILSGSGEFALRKFWAFWPMMGWGIGVAAHGLSVFRPWGSLSDDWEERKVRELMGKRDV